MRKTIAAVALTVSEVINRTFTAGDQSVNVSITNNRVEVTGGTPEAVAIVNAVLGVTQPAPQAGPAAAPAKSSRKSSAKSSGKGSGRGANQAGTKRGPYMTAKRRAALEAQANGGTPAPVEGELTEGDTFLSLAENAAPPVAHGEDGQPLPATLAPFNVEGDETDESAS